MYMAAHGCQSMQFGIYSVHEEGKASIDDSEILIVVGMVSESATMHIHTQRSAGTVSQL